MTRKINHQWERVYGPDLDKGKYDRALANSKVLNSKEFIRCCELAGIENPTRRQASKFRRGRGLAYQYK